MEMIDTYLQLYEDRKLSEASQFLATDVELTFPGERRYSTLDEVVAASRNRYAWVRKNRDEYIVAERSASDDSPEHVVTSIGTLYGEKVGGESFQGIRYVDIFTIRDGLIVEQRVWNDLAEVGITFPDDSTK